MLTTNQKGTLAEAKIAARAVELGLGIARPLDDERYDLILDLRPHLLRIQCKMGRRPRGRRRHPYATLPPRRYGSHSSDIRTG